MKYCKKALSIVLAVMMVFSVIPMTGITAFAAVSGDFKYRVISEKDKTCNITGYSGSTTEIVIPSQLDGYTVEKIDEYAFDRCTSLTSVTIPDSVTVIGSSAFRLCVSLTNVTIGNNVTEIDYEAFRGCTSLKGITIPNSVTSIDIGAFKGCSSLINVIIPNSVMSIGDNAFESCTALTNITISNSVKVIEDRTFAYCTSLVSVIIPDSVRDIESNAFYGCASLISVIIPEGVESIGYESFCKCTLLESVTIPDTIELIDIKAFGYCTSLQNIYVNDGNENYCDIDGVLFNKDLTELVCYPGGKCGDYKIINGVTRINNYAFYGCSSLTNVIIPDGVTDIDDSAFQDCTSLKDVIIPNSMYRIDHYAFNNCTSLEGVIIPEGVEYIGTQAFGDCTSLKSIAIPNGVTSIGGFKGCSALTSITIPDSITSITSECFYDCTSLTSIIIPSSVKSIGDRAFYNCLSLKEVHYGSSEEDWKKIKIGSYNYKLTNATIYYNSTQFHQYIGKQVCFEKEVYLMNVNDAKELKAYISDAYLDNGKLVYENKEPIDSSRLNWSCEENEIIRFDSNGKVTALSEGLAHLSVTVKDDINLYGNCQIYVGKPNALEYKTVYDTKQYYAENGFYSQTSSVSDCVEIYCLFENKLVNDLQDCKDKISLEELSIISPITLTATVSGNGLSFSRNSYQNTYTATLDGISAGKAVDDILMLFPYNLSVSPSGNTYTVTVTLQSDSFDTITEKYTFTVENLATKSANEHIGFVSSSAGYISSKNNVYGQTMVSLKDDAEYLWSKYSTLDFENYYEVVFADILANLVGVAQFNNLLPVIEEWLERYNTLVSNIAIIIENDYTGYLDVNENAIDKLLKKSKYETDGMNIENKLRDYLELVLKDNECAEKMNSVFAGMDKTGQALSLFEFGVNVINDIMGFTNSLAILNTYKDMDDELKAVVNNLYNQIPNSEKKMKDAVYHYVNTDTFLGYTEEFLNTVKKMAVNITAEGFDYVYKEQVISSLCKVIGNITLKTGELFSSTAAFSAVSTGLGAISTGVSLGFCISDILCNSSGKSAETSKIIAMSEFSPYVISTLNHYESKLYSDRNNTAVAVFEYAFAMHKATQSYIMGHTVKLLEIKRDSWIIKWFGRGNYDGVISDVLAQKVRLENLKCHTDGDTQTVVTKTKVIAVKCPVDVFIYDANGNEVVRIVNNVKELVADGISVAVESNEKYIALPMNQEYSVKIVATDAGTMEYFVTEYDDGVQRVQTVKKDNIALSPTRTFTGQIPKENDAAPKDYALHYDGKDVIPNDVITTPITGIKLNQNELKMHNGDKFKLTAVISPEDVTNKKVHWYSDNPEVATVDENGNVTAISTGTTTIRAVTDDWGYIDECTVKVVSKQALGDVNNDGIVDAADAVMIQRYDAGLTNLTSEQISLGDVNGDGIVDAADAVKIQRYDAGLIDKI